MRVVNNRVQTMAKIYDGQLVYLIGNRTLPRVVINSIVHDLTKKKLIVIPPFHIYGESVEETHKKDYYEFEIQKTIINDCDVALCIQTLEPLLEPNTIKQIQWAQDFAQSVFDFGEAFPEIFTRASNTLLQMEFTSGNWQKAFE